MLNLYKPLTRYSKPLLHALLASRVRAGKEDKERLNERQGIANKKRPKGKLFWVHAASVGEAQSALIFIEALLDKNKNVQILLTTGTKTSATLMAQKLPKRAFHQFYPLDHPEWVERFLDHWKPDAVFWMESELWPNMLLEIQNRKIPSALINGRLSPRSYKRWRRFKRSIKSILSCFHLVLTQTQQEQIFFEALGAKNVKTTDNLKYSAAPLSFNKNDYSALKKAIAKRPLWLYASTHKGEEELACRIHISLKENYPDLLTIIVPRHPERGTEIANICDAQGLDAVLRGVTKLLPDKDSDIYVANTLGELGLFYQLSSIACIGRSFSDDGGGGHNPIEAAQLDCAVLHGPNVQNLQDIFDDMNTIGAAIKLENESHFIDTVNTLMANENVLKDSQNKALDFAKSKTRVIHTVMAELQPLLDKVLK